LQFGGNFSQLADDWQHYRPSFVSMLPDGLPSPTSVEESPDNGFDWEGKLSIQPENSDWVLKAGIRYGRSGTNGQLHKSLAPQTAAFPITGRACTGPLHRCTAFANADANRLVDAETNAREQHTMADFTVGKEIGIGMFGADGKGTIGGGVRMAQLATDAFADLNMNANWAATHTNPRGAFAQQTWHLYQGVSKEHRSFHGWGPQVTWDADQPVWGVAESGEVSIDWGLNAAFLLGQQKIDLQQLETDTPCSSTVAGCVLPTNAPQAVIRSRHVLGPNLGGYNGASMRYHSSKISFGYRADTFFNAMDGGQDTARSYTRGFYGPYLNVSLGLGG
jgi:hypothetical protein